MISLSAHLSARSMKSIFSITRTLCKLPSVAGLMLLFITPAYADVSHEGYDIALAFILGVLFLPIFIVALSRRKKEEPIFSSAY
jgi:hypothetical protein